MKANIYLALQNRTNEEQAVQNGHILLLLNTHGKILCKLPLGRGRFNFTLEVNDLNNLANALWRFERQNPWFRVEKVSATG
ncbi:MAG: hypothetical protein ACFFDP_07610 [Promethearchaeota archaeon]